MPRLITLGIISLLTAAMLRAAPVPEGPLTPARLARDFMTNEAYAEENYVGKQIELKGKFVRVSRTKYGTPKGERDQEWVLELDQEGAGKSEKGDLDLLLFFHEDDRGELAKLKPGQTVVVQGICSRRTVWSSEARGKDKDYSQVYLEKCKLVKDK